MLIVEIYRHRPKSLSNLGLGQWFCNAVEFPDPDIYDSCNIAGTLHLIQERYGEVDLNKLIVYNDKQAALEQA